MIYDLIQVTKVKFPAFKIGRRVVRHAGAGALPVKPLLKLLCDINTKKSKKLKRYTSETKVAVDSLDAGAAAPTKSSRSTTSRLGWPATVAGLPSPGFESISTQPPF